MGKEHHFGVAIRILTFLVVCILGSLLCSSRKTGNMWTFKWSKSLPGLQCCSSSQPSAREHSPRRWHARRPCTTGLFQPSMSPQYPRGPWPPLRMLNQAPGGVPGSQPLVPSGIDPTRQQGHPNMDRPIQRMTPPKGMLWVAPECLEWTWAQVVVDLGETQQMPI